MNKVQTAGGKRPGSCFFMAFAVCYFFAKDRQTKRVFSLEEWWVKK
jgi:hypothetical protein